MRSCLTGLDRFRVAWTSAQTTFPPGISSDPHRSEN
jgi:hypothetical protein